MLYAFKAFNKHRGMIDAVVDFENEEVVINELRARGFVPLEVRPAPKGSIAIRLDDLPKPFSITQIPLEALSRKTDALINGDDSAFEELLALTQQSIDLIKANIDAVPDHRKTTMNDVLGMIESVRREWLEAGSPEAVRRRLKEVQRERDEHIARASSGELDALEKDSIRIGPGWLASNGPDVGNRAYGEIIIFGHHAIFFHEATSASKRADRLCVPADVKEFRLKGFFKKTLCIEMNHGRGWSFDIDWKSLDRVRRDEQRKRIDSFRFYTAETPDPSMIVRRSSIRDSTAYQIFSVPFSMLGEWIWKYRYLVLVSIIWFWTCLPLARTMRFLPSWITVPLTIMLMSLPIGVHYIRGVRSGRYEGGFDNYIQVIVGGGLLMFCLSYNIGMAIYHSGLWLIGLFGQ